MGCRPPFHAGRFFSPLPEEDSRGLLGKLLRAFRPAGKSKEDIQRLTAAAEAGDVAAQYELAMLYGLGKDVERDDALSLEWGRKAAEQGVPPAQGQLGGCYFKGAGVPQDDAQAVVWFRKGAEQGDDHAQYGLAACYYEVRGVEQDMRQAIAWLRKAAEQGDNQAISILRELGQEVPPVRTDA